MLVPKQWNRIVGGVVAAIVFLLLLKGFHEYRPFREVVQMPSEKFAASRPEAVVSEEPTIFEITDQSEAVVSEKSSIAVTATTSTLPETQEPTTVISTPNPTTTQASEVESLPSATPSKAPSSNFGLPESRPLAQKPTSITNSPFKEANSTSTTSSLRKAVVMGKVSSEDTDWVGQELADWEHSIYVVDLPEDMESPTGLKTKMNKANEATPYLTYIIEHYNDLPDLAVFLHAHRGGWPKAWHNDAPDYDAVNMLRGLHLPVVEERGFVNLRCMGSPGCPNEIQLNRFPVDEEKTAEIAYPYVYGDFFNMTVEDVRQQVPIVATPCCAQFAVSRTQVLQRPKSEYERWLKLIEESEVESHVLGTVMEYMWHILFGQEAVHCEQEQVCRAALYGYGNPSDWT